MHELKRRGRESGAPVMVPSSLRTSRFLWENGHIVLDEVYRRLLREVFGLDDQEFGLAEQPTDRAVVGGSADELAARLARSTTVDAELVTLVRQQTDMVRLLDRRLGAPALL